MLINLNASPADVRFGHETFIKREVFRTEKWRCGRCNWFDAEQNELTGASILCRFAYMRIKRSESMVCLTWRSFTFECDGATPKATLNCFAWSAVWTGSVSYISHNRWQFYAYSAIVNSFDVRLDICSRCCAASHSFLFIAKSMPTWTPDPCKTVCYHSLAKWWIERTNPSAPALLPAIAVFIFARY